MQTKYGRDQMWGINENFIDQQQRSGKKFTTNLPNYRDDFDSFFNREIDYLFNRYGIRVGGNVS